MMRFFSSSFSKGDKDRKTSSFLGDYLIITLQSYYRFHFIPSIQLIERPTWIGIIFQFIHLLFRLETMLSPDVIAKIKSQDENIDKFISWHIFSNTKFSSSILYILFTTHILLIISFVLHLITSASYSSQAIYKVTKKIIGIICSCYLYLLFIPNIYFSLDQMSHQNVVGPFNFFFTLLVGIILTIHDQSFIFLSKDSLCKRQDIKVGILIIGLELSTCICLVFVQNSKVMLIASFILSGFTCYESYWRQSFDKEIMRIMHRIFCFFYLELACIFYLIIIINSTNYSLIFMSISIASINVGLSIIIERSHCDILKWSTDYDTLFKSPQDLDFLMRLLLTKINVEYNKYSEDTKSILLELISMMHKETCPDIHDCFCTNELADLLVFYQSKDINDILQMRLGKDQRHNFLINHIRMTYLKYIRESYKKYRTVDYRVCLSYLNYLAQMYSSKVLSFTEMIRIKNLMNLSIREDAFLHALFINASNSFSKKEKSSLINEKKKRRIEMKDIFFTKVDATDQQYIELNGINYLLGIQFDEKVNKIETSYYTLLQEKVDLLVLLSNDHINLTELKLKGQEIMELKDDLNSQLAHIYKINQNNQKLQYFMEGFSTYFGFGFKRRHIFHKSQAFKEELLQTDLSIFSKNSCVIFVTLVNQIGKIVKVQNNFEELFGYQKQKINNNYIGIILPSCMRKKHEEVIQEYLQNPEKQKRNSFPLLLGQNERGFALPLSLKFKPDNFLLDDCGLTGLIQKPDKEYSYIQISENYFQIQTISEGIFEKCFENFFSIQELYRVYFNRVLPILNTISAKNDMNESINTIAYFPKLEIYKKGFKNFYYFDKLEKDDVADYIQKLTIEYYDIYSVKLKLFKNNYKKIPFSIIEIHSFKKITSFVAQKEALQSFKQQLDTLMNFQFDIQNDLEILEQLIELESLKIFQSIQIDSYQSANSNELDIDQDNIGNIQEEEEEHNDHETSFKKDSIIPPLNAQRQLSMKDDTINNSKLGLSQLNTLKGNVSLLDSQYGQQSRFVYGNKYLEINEFGDQQQYEEIDLQKNNLLGNSFNTQLIPLVSPSQQALLFSHSTILQPQISQSNLASPHQTLVSPHQTLVSPHQNEQSSTKVITMQQDKGISLFRSSKAEQIIDLNNFNDYSIKQQSSYIPFKKQSTFNTTAESKFDIVAGSTVKDISKTHVDPLRQLEPVKSVERLISITNILSEYYDQICLEKTIKSNRKKIKSNEKNQILMAGMPSPLSKERIKKKQIKLQQILKDKVRIAKMLIQQQGYQESSQGNETQQAENLKSLPIFGKTDFFHEPSSPVSQGKVYYNFPKSAKERDSEIRKKSLKKEIQNNKQSKKNPVRSLGFEDNTYSEQFSDSFDKEDVNEQQMEIQRSKILGTSSVHTSQTQNQEQKKLIQKLVNSKKRNLSLMALMVFGVVGLFSFLTLIIYQYYQNVLTFDIAALNFKYFPWALSQRFNFSTIFADLMFREAIRSNQITSFDDISSDLASFNDDFKKAVQSYKKNTYNFFYTNLEDTSFFKFTQITRLTYIQSKDVQIIPQPLVNNTKYKIYQNVTLQYFMLRLQFLFWKSLDDPDLQTQIIMQDNFGAFMNTVSLIKTALVNSVLDIISSITSQSMIIMTLVVIAVSLLAFATFPLNFHITQKSENTLKLFATISSQSLLEMLQPIMRAISQHKNSKTKIIKLENCKKRKAISSTTTLKKFQFMHLIYIILGIIFMVIQPIVSYIYIDQFYQEAILLTNLSLAFYQARPLLASTRTVHYSLIIYKIGTFNVYNSPYFFARIKAISNDFPSTMASIYDTVKQSQGSQRYQEDLYQNFFYKLIEGDVCSAIESHPEFIPTEMSISIPNCKQVRLGLLQKGIDIAIKDYVETFKGMVSYYDIKNQSDFVAQYNSSLNLKEFEMYFQLICNTIEIMKEFLGKRIISFMDTMNLLFQGLLIYQLIMMILVFYFGYMKFYYSAEKQLFDVKRILNILSIETVLENPYIISFLTKEE